MSTPALVVDAGQRDRRHADAGFAGVLNAVVVEVRVDDAGQRSESAAGHPHVVEARRVRVEEIDEVRPRQVGVARLRQPDVFRRQVLAVGAQDRAGLRLARERIGHLDEREAGRRREREVVGAAGRHPERRARGLVDRDGVRAFGLVDAQHVDVQREEVAHVVAPRQVDLHVVHEQVRRHALDQRRQRAAEAVGVRVGGREVDELARQRGHHVPAPDRARARPDVAEIDDQRLGRGLVVDVAVEDLEADQQSLRVVDDLRLCRFDRDLGRGAAADVPDAHAQRERHRRLDGGRERVVGVHVAGEKVVERQQRLRLDRDEVRRDGNRRRVAEQRTSGSRRRNTSCPAAARRRFPPPE